VGGVKGGCGVHAAVHPPELFDAGRIAAVRSAAALISLAVVWARR